MIGSLSVFLAGHIGVFTLDAIQVIKPVLTSSSWRGWDASGQFRPPALAPAMRRPPSAQSWAGLVAKTLEGKAVVELLAGRDARKSVSSSQARLGRRKRAALGRQALSLAVASASEMFRPATRPDLTNIRLGVPGLFPASQTVWTDCPSRANSDRVIKAFGG